MYGALPFGSRPYGALRQTSGALFVGPHPTVTRAIIEVIGTNDYAPPAGKPAITRAILEVIGSAAAIAGKSAQIARAVAEVIGTADQRKRGLAVPSVAVTLPSVFVVLDPENWATGGQFALQDAAGRGLIVFGDATTTTLRWSDGTHSASASFATPTGKARLTFIAGATPAAAQIRLNGVAQTVTTSGSSWSAVTLTDLCQLRPLSNLKAGQIAELMVLNRTVTNTERDFLESYQATKWP